MQGLIPLYSADLELKDWISPQRMNRLVALDLVSVVRSRKGTVKRVIQRRRASDGRPFQPADYLGTRYSHQEHLDNGYITWALKRLGKGDELRPVFLRVVSDCLVAHPEGAELPHDCAEVA
jgi:hypothetical protein